MIRHVAFFFKLFTTAFVGTRRDYGADNPGIGEVFSTVTGNSARCTIPDDALYLRATITSNRNHPNPSFPGQHEQAWIQPVGWEK